MATSSDVTQRDMLDLVLRSRKALDHTKSLCSRAETLAKQSTNLALDVVATNAKVRWASDMISEQTKLVGNVAKTLGAQKNRLENDAKTWDIKRKERTTALDSILDDLGSQLVPPSFYEDASGSSLFGSHPSLQNPIIETHSNEVSHRDDGATTKDAGTRMKWKSLRFFVDERAIEEAIERMDEDRTALEDLLESTSSQTQGLSDHIQEINKLLPSNKVNLVPSIYDWLRVQEEDLNRMAQGLEDVTRHFIQMENALGDYDAGVILNDEDMEVLEGDTSELPSIIEEMEQSLNKIETINEKFREAQDSSNAQLARQKTAISSLETLGVELGSLIEQYQVVEIEAAALSSTLQGHLVALSGLYETYINYRASYGNLVQEMDRRRRYRDTVNMIIGGMNDQLKALREEEISHREQFFKSDGVYLPEDLCPFVGNFPTEYEVIAMGEEAAVAIDSEYVAEVQRYITRGQTGRE
ncbi:hypothetical protein CPB86DRAFT_747681 [Serendipita vermifera]|nr:hypothetical protein CPB86DRAFT_747681 [Serendipita vermifera]